MKKLIILLASLLSFSAYAVPISALVVPGTMIAYGGTSCPVGYVSEDGSSLLRAGKYASLFAVLGTAYGSADGTHFNLPDLRGKFMRMVDGSAGNDPDKASRTACNTGGATGNNVGSCQADQFKAHTHSIGQSSTGGLQAGPTNIYPIQLAATLPSGSAGGNETRPINVYVLYCIKY